MILLFADNPDQIHASDDAPAPRSHARLPAMTQQLDGSDPLAKEYDTVLTELTYAPVVSPKPLACRARRASGRGVG